MDSKTLMQSSAGALQAPSAAGPQRQGAPTMRSLGARYGVSDPRSRVCYNSACTEDGKKQLADIETGITKKLGDDRANSVMKPLKALVDCAKGSCEVEVTLSKTDLSESALSVSVRIPTLQGEIPLALLDDVAGLLPGLRFSLSTSGRKSEYITGLGEEQGVRSPGLPGMLENLVKVVEQTKRSRLV